MPARTSRRHALTPLIRIRVLAARRPRPAPFACHAAYSRCSLPVRCGCQRSQQKVHGVRLIDHNASHLVFDVEVPTPTGRLRASVMVARQLLGDAQLQSWSDEELAFLFFMSSCVPTCYKLAPGTTWAVVAHLLSGEQIADKLRGATGVAHGRQATATAIRVIREHCQTARGPPAAPVLCTVHWCGNSRIQSRRPSRGAKRRV